METMVESAAYKRAVSVVFGLTDLAAELDEGGYVWRAWFVRWGRNLLIRHVQLPLSPYLSESMKAK